MKIFQIIVLAFIIFALNSCGVAPVETQNDNNKTKNKNDETTKTIKPLANAGIDQSVFVGEIVNFDASNSKDSDGSIVSYEWKENNTSLLSKEKIFTLATLSIGEHYITLIVTDNDKLISSDQMKVTVKPSPSNNNPPLANAGIDIIAFVGNTVKLDASNSKDSDGSIVSYEWKENNTLLLGKGETFTLNTLKVGEHNITLIVKDNQGLSSKDEMKVTIKAISSTNQAPIANAGVDKEALVDESVSLDASNSSDDRGISTYQWKENNSILGTGKILSLNNLPIGTHTITLIVSDSGQLTSSDEVTVVIKAKPIPPLAKAGIDQVAYFGDTVNLNASSSSDDKSIVSYEWKENNSTVLGVVKILSLNNLPLGVHHITLIVKDSDKLISSDEIQVTINPRPIPPVANAGKDIIAYLGISIDLNASKSTDDKGIFSYQWKENNTSLLGTGVILSLNNLALGEHNITLIVTDNDNLVSSDEVKVIIEMDNSQQIRKTGQTIVYETSDDGTYQKGLTLNFTRDTSNETVTDHLTRLQWQDNNDSRKLKKTIINANTYCNNLNLGGYTNWRLPTIRELEKLIDYSKSDAMINSAFLYIASTNQDYYWSSTVQTAPHTHFSVLFHQGLTTASPDVYAYFTKCVREIK